jgi:hypothetical protein
VFELAYRLRTFAHVIYELPYDEYAGWFAYFEKYPVEWRDDDRTYKLLKAQGAVEGLRPEKVFPSLETIYNSKRTSLANSGLTPFLLKAKGGVQIPFSGDK